MNDMMRISVLGKFHCTYRYTIQYFIICSNIKTIFIEGYSYNSVEIISIYLQNFYTNRHLENNKSQTLQDVYVLVYVSSC